MSALLRRDFFISRFLSPVSAKYRFAFLRIHNSSCCKHSWSKIFDRKASFTTDFLEHSIPEFSPANIRPYTDVGPTTSRRRLKVGPTSAEKWLCPHMSSSSSAAQCFTAWQHYFDVAVSWLLSTSSISSSLSTSSYFRRFRRCRFFVDVENHEKTTKAKSMKKCYLDLDMCGHSHISADVGPTFSRRSLKLRRGKRRKNEEVESDGKKRRSRNRRKIGDIEKATK